MTDELDKTGKFRSPANLNLTVRILLPLVLVTVISSFVIVKITYEVEMRHIRAEVVKIQSSMRQVYALSLEKRAEKLHGELADILSNERLLDAFKSGNRRALLNQARPLYERLNATSEVSHFYFHGTDRVNLMRVHLPNHFGDTIERQTLLHAESSGATTYGAELGPFGTFTLRAVAPWYDNGSLVGYVELGTSMADMVEVLADMFAVRPYMIVSKKFMMRERWEGIKRKLGKIPTWDLLPNSVIIAGPPGPLPDAFINLLASQTIDGDFSGKDIIDGLRSYITGDIALRDLAERDVGRLVMLVDTTARIADLENAIREMAIVAAILGALLLVIFYSILHSTEHLYTASHRKILAQGHARVRLQQEHIAELERLALYDPLTDLPNRKLLQDRIAHAIKGAQREGYPLALTVLNLDRLREINNTLGHQAGDIVLKEIADRLRESTRGSDTVARLGGDEFAVLMPKLTPAASQAAVEKLQSLLGEPIDIEDVPVSVTASFGIAFYPEDCSDAYHLVQYADVAMRDARRLHHGIVVYDSDRDPYSLRKLKLLSNLKSAITDKEFFLEYQPKINVSDPYNVAQAEALVRWNHPTEGLLLPSEFVPLLENTALIKTLTLYVLEEALYQCAAWRKQGLEINVSVNVSMFDLLTSDVSDEIGAMLERYGTAPNSLTLEITESVIMAEPELAIRVLRKLEKMNIALSIDDFGTGYSSLAYLQQLPVEELKIDRSFIGNLAVNHNDQVIVQSTIQLAHNLGLHVVAEGVEDRATWEKLARLRCDTAQGYYISPPLPADEFSKWVHASTWRKQQTSLTVVA